MGRQRLYAIEKYPLPVAPIYEVKGILYTALITLTITVETRRINAEVIYLCLMLFFKRITFVKKSGSAKCTAFKIPYKVLLFLG